VVETHCHNIDVLNWFLGARPESAIGSAGRSIERRGDISDHVNVTFAYPGGVHAAFTGSQVAPQYYRTNNERFFCGGGVIETAREYWAKYTAKTPVVEQAPCDITVDALAEFLRRVAQGKPENTAARSAESTMTAVLARMACDAGRRVTWEEMLRAGTAASGRDETSDNSASPPCGSLQRSSSSTRPCSRPDASWSSATISTAPPSTRPSGAWSRRRATRRRRSKAVTRPKACRCATARCAWWRNG
jgi:hypothetical protein